jgi:hypothetical protein
MFAKPLRPRTTTPSSTALRAKTSRRPLFETLESRRLLANYTWNDAANTLSISLANNESLTVYTDGSNNLFELDAGTFSQLGGDNAPGNGSNTITIAAANLATSVTIDNSTVSTGTNDVTFAGGLLSADMIAVTITDPDAVGTISAIGAQLVSTGTGGITLETRRDIVVAFNALLSTTDGDITLRANQQSDSSSGQFFGIGFWANGGIRTNGTGDILLEGRGGDTDFPNTGIHFHGKLESTATGPDAGKITLYGQGGLGQLGIFGVLLGGEITSVDGDIRINGIGGGDAAGETNRGILLLGVILSSTGTGSDAAKITVNGKGGVGIESNAGVYYAAGEITSKDGDIQVTGNQGSGAEAEGVFLWSYPQSPLKSTGTAEIVVTSDGSNADRSKLRIAIHGTAVDTGYDQLSVVDPLSLKDMNLVLSGNYVPVAGDVFTIVDAPAIEDQFNGLIDGSTVIFNGVELVVRYTATTVKLSYVREFDRVVRNAGDVLVLGAEAGAQPRVKVLDVKDGSVVANFLAYSADFRGGVRVAVADLNRDGEAEIIVAPGAGMSTLVKVFDLEGHELQAYRTKAYAGFRGGVFVAVGDVNGDGRADLITAPAKDLNSNIKVFKNRVGIASSNPDPISNNPIYSFLAFDTITRRGATVAAGDFNRDGKAEVVVGNVAGTSPLVRVFDLTEIASTSQLQLAEPMFELHPFKSTDRGGVFLAVGNVRNTTIPDILVGNGARGRGRVEIYSGATTNRVNSFTAFDTGEGRDAPVHVAAKSININPFDEIIISQGAPGSIGRLRAFGDIGVLEDEVFQGEDDFRFGFFIA